MQIRYFLVPVHDWMTRFETEVAGSTGDAPEGKWILGGGIEIPCKHKVYEGIGPKKNYLLYQVLDIGQL